MREDLADAINDLYKKRGVELPDGLVQVENPAPISATTASSRLSAKKMFPLRNKYLAKIKSLNAKGKTYEATGLMQAQHARLQNAGAKTWRTPDGKEVDRYHMMKYIVDQIGRGKLISHICSGSHGMPSLQTVIAWKEEHPDFKQALNAAKKIQAIVLAEEGLQNLRDADKTEASLAKAQFEGLLRWAALGNEDFKEKQVIQTENLAQSSVDELKAQLASILKDNPGLLPPELANLALPTPTLTVSPEDEEPNE